MKQWFLPAFTLCCYASICNAQIPHWEWYGRIGGNSNENNSEVVLDSEKNFYLLANFNSDTLIHGADTLTTWDQEAGYDLFLTKFDSAHNLLWTKSITGDDIDPIAGLGIDKWNNLYLGFRHAGSEFYFGSDTLNVFNDAIHLAILKCDANGNLIWLKEANPEGNGVFNFEDLFVDLNGNSLITGAFFSPTFKVGSIELQLSGLEDFFVAKMDSGGNVIWAKSAASSSFDIGVSITGDSFGNVYATGHCNAPLSIDTITLAANNDAFLVRFDKDGNLKWFKGFGTNVAFDWGSISIDPFEDIILAGKFDSYKLILGADTLINENNATFNFDAFVAKIDSSGSDLWARSAEHSVGSSATDVTTDQYGNVYLAGLYPGNSLNYEGVKFGGFEVGVDYVFPTTNGSEDAFVAMYNKNGFPISALAVYNTDEDYITSLASNDSGRVHFGGYYNEFLLFGSDTVWSYASTDNNGMDVWYGIVTLPCIAPHANIETTDSIICADQIAMIRCDASGLDYQWELNGINIAGADKQNYYTTVAGSYRCKIYSPCGNDTTNSIQVTVNPVPAAFIEVTGDTFVCKDEKVKLNTFQDNSFLYQWYKNNSIALSGATNYNYNATNSGYYYVELTNEYGCIDTSDSILANISTSQGFHFFKSADTLCITDDPIVFTGDPFPPDTIIGDGIVNGYAFHPSVAGLGLHIVYAKYTGNGGCHSTDSIYVLVVNCTSNHQIDINISAYMAPNPFSEFSYLYFPEQLFHQGGDLEIFDQLGRIVVNAKKIKESPYRVEGGLLIQGIYHYRLSSTSNVINGSFLRK